MMLRGRLTARSALAILTCTLSLAACVNPIGLVSPIPRSAGPVNANVVDAITNKPLEGVVVVEEWVNITPSFEPIIGEHGDVPRCYQVVNLSTATTDSEGRFTVPAWSAWGHCAQMNRSSPLVLFYKPGYKLLDLHHNAGDDFPDLDRDQDSADLDGQTIKLYPLGPHSIEGSEDSYVWQLSRFNQMLESYLDPTDQDPVRCFWTEARPAILMLLREELRLRPYSRGGWRFLDDDLISPDQAHGTRWSCGNQKAYIEELRTEARSTLADTPSSSQGPAHP